MNFRATLTSRIKTGTSRSGPITVAKAWPELIPKMAMATAIASSKSLEAAAHMSRDRGGGDVEDVGDLGVRPPAAVRKPDRDPLSVG